VPTTQLRTKRDKLAAELTELRAASSAQPLEASQSQASQAAASDDLADALGAFSM
jgi:ribosomal protein L29